MPIEATIGSANILYGKSDISISKNDVVHFPCQLTESTPEPAETRCESQHLFKLLKCDGEH